MKNKLGKLYTEYISAVSDYMNSPHSIRAGATEKLGDWLNFEDFMFWCQYGFVISKYQN
jgi:hypothetical protein